MFTDVLGVWFVETLRAASGGDRERRQVEHGEYPRPGALCRRHIATRHLQCGDLYVRHRVLICG